MSNVFVHFVVHKLYICVHFNPLLMELSLYISLSLFLTNFQAHLFLEQTTSAGLNFNNFWPQITLASGLKYVTRLQAGILQRVAVNRSNFSDRKDRGRTFRSNCRDRMECGRKRSLFASSRLTITMWGICWVCTLALTVAKTSFPLRSLRDLRSR